MHAYMFVKVVRMVVRQQNEVDTWKVVQVDGRVRSTGACYSWSEVNVIYKSKQG